VKVKGSKSYKTQKQIEPSSLEGESKGF